MKMNSDYFLALAKTFEKRYGVEFQGIRDGAVKDARERLIQFKTNIDVVMSLLDRNGIGDWLADRLVEIGESLPDDHAAAVEGERGSLPRRAAACGEPAGRAAEGLRHERGDRCEEGRLDYALPQGRRSGRHASRHLRDREVGELRHGQPLPHDRRGSLRVDQPRTREYLGSLRSGDQRPSARASRRRFRKPATCPPPSAS